jgi:glycine/D-amino acid oxidase-like deaminating enzyme
MSIDQLNRRGFLGFAAGTAGAVLAPSGTYGAPGRVPQSQLSYHRDLPLYKAFDVVVCGGGPSGVAAALSARRAGATVLLVEGQGQLGGMGVSGLVSHWLGGRTSDCSRWVVGGLFRTMAREAAERGCALIPKPDPNRSYQPHGWHKGQLAAGIPFDPFAMASYLDEKVTASGVDILLLTQVVDVRLQGRRVTQIIIYNKSGLAAIPARAVIDATGDADVVARSGCTVVKGREADGLMTPTTLQFHVYNVDQDALSTYIHTHQSPRFRTKVRELRKAGEWPFPYDIVISAQLNEKGTMMINTSRLVGIDGTDGRSLTEGMMRGRAETKRLLTVLRKHFPGFADAKIKAVASVLGVRETRRIVGDFVLTVDDLVAGRDFPDTIGLSSYGWDLPDPKRPSHQPMTAKKVRRKRPVTPLPYRIMLPKPVENLICPGRSVSVERDVLGPIRVMAPCMAMGEAAGMAAAWVARDQAEFRNVDVHRLQVALKNAGAIVEWRG